MVNNERARAEVDLSLNIPSIIDIAFMHFAPFILPFGYSQNQELLAISNGSNGYSVQHLGLGLYEKQNHKSM